MKRALLVLFLAACSSSKPTPVQPVASAPIEGDAGAAPTAAQNKDAGPTDPAMSAKETRVVAKTLDLMSELRGVKSTRAVPGVKLKREELVARVKEKALREYPPEALRREGQLIQIMGFAPATFDYLGEMMKLLEAQLEGFYDPKNGTMYLASELRG